MAIKSAVIVREIWDARDYTGNFLEGDAIQKALDTRFDPEDLNALELALQVQDKYGGEVTVLSLGEPKHVDVLRESLYRGATRVIRLQDDAFQELDTAATASVFAEAIERLGDIDLIFCGVNVNEGENALLGTMMANRLGREQISYVDNLEKIEAGAVICRRAVEMGFETLQAALPLVLNVGIALVKEDPRTPRSAKAALKLKLKKAPLETQDAGALGLADIAGSIRTVPVRREPLPQKLVVSRAVDPENETELKEMLAAVRS